MTLFFRVRPPLTLNFRAVTLNVIGWFGLVRVASSFRFLAFRFLLHFSLPVHGRPNWSWSGAPGGINLKSVPQCAPLSLRIFRAHRTRGDAREGVTC